MLTLHERKKVIKRSDQGDTTIMTANFLVGGKAQIQNKIKRKGAILMRCHGGESGGLKFSKIHKSVYTMIEEQVWKWFCEVMQRKIPVTRDLVREKALCLEDLMISRFGTDGRKNGFNFIFVNHT